MTKETQRVPPPEQSAQGSVQLHDMPPDLMEVVDAEYVSLAGLAAGSREAQEYQRHAVQKLALPLEVRTRKTGIVFRLVPPGTFKMGDLSSESEGDAAEIPHQVTLTRAFYCGKYEVTQAQWEQVYQDNQSRFKNAGPDAPVERMSWQACQVFLDLLCQMEGVPKGTYRLLTEAEWEYACRAGTQTVFCYGNDLDASMANFDGDSPYGAGRRATDRRTTIAVGLFQPNAWGLYDMHGNVEEWCQDWWGSYPTVSVSDPLGPPYGLVRITRGGSWHDKAWDCRSARRYSAGHGRSDYVGLRVARTAPACP